MAGTDEVTPETIPHLHKSFVEFVTGKNIRPDLQVSLLFSHKELAPKCLAHSVDVGDLYFHASRFSYQWTINELPNDHPDLPAYLGCFGDLERANYQHSGGVTSLDTSISVLTRAIQLTPKGHPDQPSYCSNLGKSLLHRFERFGDLDDLNQAISRREAAARLTPEAHPDQPSYCSDLGKSLLTRFERLGDLNDLNQAISRHEAAVRLTPEAHPDKPSRLANLGNSLLSRFEQLGDLDDLNQAISRREAAVRLTPEAHPDQPSYCSDLGKSLLSHFERLGDLNDLNQSVSRHEAAVKLTPEAHPDKPSRLANLGNSLLSRFEQLGDLDDLNQAISCHEAVIRLAPEAYPDKPSQLGNLGNSLLRRFEQLGDLDDLNQAISLYEAAVKLTPDGHPDKPSQLGNLGNSLLSRFKRLGDLDDINQSVLMLEAAVQLTPDRHPDKPSRLNNLGNSLHQRFERLHNPQDSQQLLLQYTLAACLLTGPAHIRFHAATIWANHARILQHNSVLRAYATAIGLLPELAWLGLSISDRLHSLLQAGQVVRDAASAAIAVHDYQKAVEWLEQGRSVIWGQLISLRTPVDHLLESYPELAAKLIFLSPSLERPESIAQQSHALALERDHLLQQIRELPGFERFLLPRSISELSLVAQVGLVAILNISKYGCDALILMPGLGDEVIHVPLHDFTLLEAQVLVKSLALGQREKSMASDKIFSHILSELWLKVVQPVLNALGITTPSHQDLPRIWWCPTGPLAFLPIHAAGIYGEHEAFGSKLSDFLISSYTPSLTALIQGFRPRSESQNRLQLLAVSQPSGQGRSHAGIEQEIRCIERHAMGKVHVLRLDQDTATIDRFRQSIRDATWVHFAGNVQNPSAPTDTALLLARNSRFTLSDILQLRLPHADLAFLSANHTAAGSKDLEDESVHLVAAMLSAGYRGVIGAMWDFRDDAAVQVADEVYAHLFKTSPPDSTSAAEALHIAVRRLREGPGANASFQRWVPFVHFGV
ncbi:CHAT domain-containing protein [Mycena vulgaris]|nr:CHAT domain-containing protein [Mycena vulgaris]